MLVDYLEQSKTGAYYAALMGSWKDKGKMAKMGK